MQVAGVAVSRTGDTVGMGKTAEQAERVSNDRGLTVSEAEVSEMEGIPSDEELQSQTMVDQWVKQAFNFNAPPMPEWK